MNEAAGSRNRALHHLRGGFDLRGWPFAKLLAGFEASVVKIEPPEAA
jgi:hypothetical protein